MSKYQNFIFKSYAFDKASRTLSLNYSYDNQLNFTESYTFDFDYASYSDEALDRACQLLFFLAGVSYYKMYFPAEIVVEAGQIDDKLTGFLSRTYQKGLGEFFYVNGLNPASPVTFPVNSPELSPIEVANEGKLVAIGGGKDSLVSVELLRDEPKLASWSLNHRSQLEPLVERVGLTHFWVDRHIDSQIIELNKQDALNGHIPISAIFSAVGLIVCNLSGYKDNIVSNESSASEPTLHIDGVAINHQYSKSLEYEKDFQDYLANNFSGSLRYYSFLRPLSEVRIAEIFGEKFLDKYIDVFSSCNRAFTHDQHHMFWCGECAKCAFIFLALTPFVDKDKLLRIWNGKNLLLETSLESMYRKLLGIEGDKPLDCVGEVKETRAAMRLAQQVYPELSKYQFDIPPDYDFRAWSEHSMPEDVFVVLKEKLA